MNKPPLKPHQPSASSQRRSVRVVSKQDPRPAAKRGLRPEHQLALGSLLVLILGIVVFSAGLGGSSEPSVEVSSLPTSHVDLYTKAPSPTPPPVSTLYDENSHDGYDTSAPTPEPRETLHAWLQKEQDPAAEELLRLYDSNPDARSFADNYPALKGTLGDCTLTQRDLQVQSDRMLPLFIQWDDRWGYSEYGGYLFATNACGPTTLSMVIVGLTHNTAWTPRAVADFAEDHYFASPGGGSEWILMSRGGPLLGLTVEELYPSEALVRREVEAGHPVVCIMGPGHFTTGGHYIVICGTQGDKFIINDSNSPTRSQQLWDFDTFKSEIRNLWAFSY